MSRDVVRTNNVPCSATWVDNSVIEPVQDEALRAPEVILGAQWNSSVDIWNLGCLVSSYSATASGITRILTFGWADL